MKKSLLLILLIWSLAGCLFQTAGAQEKGTEKSTQTPAGTPSNKPSAGREKLKAIWDYDKELGLSQYQVKRIKELVIDLSKQLTALEDKLKTAELKLQDMVDREAVLEQIKLELQKIAAIQVEIRYADIKISREINHVLTREQLAKWRKIQEKVRSGEK